jgi:hypothetical protein
MEYHDGFTVTLTGGGGKVRKAYIPPCWMLTGPERKQAAAQEKAALRRGKLARYWEALQQRRLL